MLSIKCDVRNVHNRIKHICEEAIHRNSIHMLSPIYLKHYIIIEAHVWRQLPKYHSSTATSIKHTLFWRNHLGKYADNLKCYFLSMKSISAIAIIYNICVTIYLFTDNAKNYRIYQQRDLYVIRRAANSMSFHFIVKANMNDTTSCPPDALFTFDATVIYKNVISKEAKRNKLFIAVYWVSTITAVMISTFDIVLSMYRFMQYKTDRNKLDRYELMMQYFGSVISQFLHKSSYSLPTFLIGIFDYNEPCLRYYLSASLLILHHTDIDILITLYSLCFLIVWTFICWQLRRYRQYHDIVRNKFIELVSCSNKTTSCIFIIVFCVTIIPTGFYGIFVWSVSIIQHTLTVKSVSMILNFALGVVHDLAQH
jgi:hypothetical protein